MHPERNSKCLECLAKSECKIVLTSAYDRKYKKV